MWEFNWGVFWAILVALAIGGLTQYTIFGLVYHDERAKDVIKFIGGFVGLVALVLLLVLLTFWKLGR